MGKSSTEPVGGWGKLDRNGRRKDQRPQDRTLSILFVLDSGILLAVDHVALTTLEAEIERVREAPLDRGRVELIVRRPPTESREMIAEATLDQDQGLVGNSWLERAGGAAADRVARRDTQIMLMNARTARLIAGDQERWALAGDQFHVDLDLSAAPTYRRAHGCSSARRCWR